MTTASDHDILAHSIADICALWIEDGISDSRAMYSVLAQLTIDEVAAAQDRLKHRKLRRRGDELRG